MKRGLLLFLVLAGSLGGALLLAACASSAVQPPVGTASPLPGSLAVTDALGRITRFAEPPQRIVLAGKATLPIANTIYLFPEAKDRVVGLVVGQQPIGDFLSLVDSNWDEKVILAVDAGPEQIAPLDPDVVVLRSFMAENLGRALEQLDIPVVYVDLETPEQYFRDVATLGQLLNNGQRATEIQAYYQSKLDAIAQAVRDLEPGDRPEVLLVQYSNQGGNLALNVPPASWIQTTEAELAGGRPVWADAAKGGGWTVVNFEQIAAWDPDQIMVIAYQADSAAIVQELVADERWLALRAVQDGKTYGFGSDVFSWDQPDPRWILGVTWLAGKMHPDRFPDLDMQQEVVGFFGQMYGMEEAAIQAKILPKLQGDVE